MNSDPRSVPKESFVTANQLKHHLLTWDGGDRATVLCLHGFLDSAWGFAPIGPALAEHGYRVIAVDMRGHGDTDHVGVGSSYLFYDYIFDLKELVDALAPQRLFLVGHSMGSAIAALYTGAFPDKVERLALLEGLAMPDHPLEDSPGLMANWIDLVARARKRKARVYPSLDAAANAIIRNDPLCPRDVALMLAEHGTRAVDGGRAFKHDPVHLAPNPYPYRHEAVQPFWEAIRCKTLILYGARTDMQQPEEIEERLSHFKTARRATIPDAGHMMIRHQPAAVAKELLEFFEG
jgi:pimeloyl-ACP methyl ester carboxylesterase